MKDPVNLLLIEDDASLASGLQRVLADEGYQVTLEKRGDEGLSRGQRDNFQVVVTDLKLPGLDGLSLVRQLHAAKPHLPLVLMTAHGTTETAIQAIKLGAFDYLLKPFEIPEFLELVAKAATSHRLMTQLVELGRPAASRDAIIGTSRVMQNIYKEIGRVATLPVTVLIRGETGTGKELIARAIYQHSDRVEAPFVAINCAAIPETLLESELFGHERGAFTGAETRRIGRFEQAQKGTIFLDEIGDLSPGTQVKLLRVLQEKQIQRLGGMEIIPTDVRVIAATHRNLEDALRENQFREDLFYRLSVMVIQLPPLRDRREDIPELVHYFLQKYSGEFNLAVPAIQPEALGRLQAQPYPGNVRELQNAIRKLLLLTRGYPIQPDHVSLTLAKSSSSPPGAAPELTSLVAGLLAAAQRGELEDAHGRAIELMERELFRQAITLAGGNQAKAARWLGVSRVTMREKLIGFDLHPRDS